MANTDDLDRTSDARVGKTLGGKWTLDRLIGVGGMASVYAASHRNGAVAAIKILHPEFARRTEARSRFKREAYIANKAGPGAVRVLDDDVDDDGAPYLVMELLRGEPVDARADRMGGRLQVPEVLWITEQTLATLEVAHKGGIIHRDLKPENLFWTVDDRLKVLDFGIARLHDASTTERTRAGLIMGTPGFMAPEQALGSLGEQDARTDLWAVGAIMFRLLTGRDVHSAAEGSSVLITAATKRAPSLGTVDSTLAAELVQIVDRALQFERDDRYPDAGAMRKDIERFTREEEVEPSVPSVRFSPPRPSRLEDIAATEFPAESTGGAGLATGMSDDDTLNLRDLLSLIEETLFSRAARGESNLGSFRKLEAAHRHATAALATAHIGLFWNVLPEGFATRQGLLWVAKPPLPPTPAKMYEGGVRMLGLLPGLGLEELGEFVRLIGGDLAPFSDFATFLQAAQLEHVVYRIDPTKPGVSEDESISLDPTSSDDADVPAMLHAVATSDPAMRAALLTRLEHVGEGHEREIASLLSAAGSVELAMGLLRLLRTLGTDAAREAMRVGTKSTFPIVRVDALASLEAGGDRLRAELRALLENANPAARLEGLVAVETYRIKASGPALALRIKSASFDTLPIGERRQALSTLSTLMPSRAEAIAVELLRDQRIISPEAHEATRELACEVLGRIGTSREAREAIEAASKSRWRSSEKVRAAARFALDTFDVRAIPPSSSRRHSSRPPRRSKPPSKPPPNARSGRPTTKAPPARAAVATKRPPPSPAKRPPPLPAKRPSKRPPKIG